MNVVYKKDIIDKIEEEISLAKRYNKKIEVIYLTYMEAIELTKLVCDVRISHPYSPTNFYIKSYEMSSNSDAFLEIKFEHNLNFELMYKGSKL